MIAPGLLAALLALPCPELGRWPGADWPSRAAETAKQSPSAIAALEDYAFTLVGTDAERRGIRTDAVLIVRGGQLIYERYGRGWSRQQRHLAWSVSKSMTSALVGRAVAAGLIRVDDSICALLGDPKEHCDITVDHLLQFASGLDWKEVYENESNQASSVLAMLYGHGHEDWAAFVLSHASRAAPGASFSYSTGDSTLLLSAVHRAVEQTQGRDWPWTLLFEPIGLRSAVFERDARGNIGGGSYFYATARDYLRLGYLYLRDGCWDGQRLLPEDWVTRSTTISPALYATPNEALTPGDIQGRQWWLNRGVPKKGLARPWKAAPEDTYAAIGHWGQYVVVVPSADTVIVRLGDDRDKTFDLGTFIGLALAVGAAP